MAAGKEEFRGDNVLAHAAYMLPGKGRRLDFHPIVTARVDLFDHDDGVGIGGQNVAGIDVKSVLPDLELPGAGLAGTEGLLGLNRDAIHGRGVEIRRRQAGEHRRRQNPSHGVRHRNRFGGGR
jgi:hypothetical protein